MSSREKEHIIEELFNRNYTKLHFYATYILGNGEQARDLVSDTFVRLLEKDILPEGTNDQLDAYLFMMVRNRCLDALRHREVENDFLEMARLADKITAENYEEYDERLQKILSIIENMPPQSRFVFEQCYLQERKYKDVANAMGITVEGVKKHIVRGLAKIRKCFNLNYKK